MGKSRTYRSYGTTFASKIDVYKRQVFHVAVTASDYVTRSGKEVGGDVKVQLTVDEAKVQEYNSLCGTCLLYTSMENW